MSGASLPSRFNVIFPVLCKVSRPLAQKYAVWEVRRWNYWTYGRGIYVRLRRANFRKASLPGKFWMLVEDVFFKFGRETMHDNEPPNDQAEYKLGGLSLFIFRGSDGWDMLHYGRHHLVTFHFYRRDLDELW